MELKGVCAGLMFLKAVAVAEAADGLAAFRRLDDRVLIALDGTKHFRSRNPLPVLFAPATPGRQGRFLPFLSRCNPWGLRAMPGSCHCRRRSLRPRTERKSRTCERAVAKRWLARVGATPGAVPAGPSWRRPCVSLPTDRRGHPDQRRRLHPDLQAKLAQDDHRVPRRRQTDRAPSSRSSARKEKYLHLRWLTQIPLGDSKDALIFNWLSVEILNAKGRRTHNNSFVTDLPVTAETSLHAVAHVTPHWLGEKGLSRCPRFQ